MNLKPRDFSGNCFGFEANSGRGLALKEKEPRCDMQRADILFSLHPLSCCFELYNVVCIFCIIQYTAQVFQTFLVVHETLASCGAGEISGESPGFDPNDSMTSLGRRWIHEIYPLHVARLLRAGVLDEHDKVARQYAPPGMHHYSSLGPI